jgi:hypothetical protein
MSVTTVELVCPSALALSQLSEEDRGTVLRLKHTYPPHILESIFSDHSRTLGQSHHVLPHAAPGILTRRRSTIEMETKQFTQEILGGLVCLAFWEY